MRLILVRHGKSEDRIKWVGKNDDLRPLVKSGQSDVLRLAKKLLKLEKTAGVIISSPLVRAHQTAEILQKKINAKKFEISDDLKANSPPEAFLEYLLTSKHKKIICVGHEPYLSELFKLLVGAPEARVRIKKGAAVILQGKINFGRAKFELIALIPPDWA